MDTNVPELFTKLARGQAPILTLGLPEWVEKRLLWHCQPIDTVEKLLVLNQRYLYYFVYGIGRKALKEINQALVGAGYPELTWKPKV